MKDKLLNIDKSERNFTGANWNEAEDKFTQVFWDQNTSQFWLPEEVALQPDINLWSTLSPEIKRAYAQNLTVLTFLDTYQGEIGMNVVSRSIDEKYHQRKTLLNFMAMMEGVHAKSYSNIFMTYMDGAEIDELFEWGQNNAPMQKILSLIIGAYEELDRMNYMKKYGELDGNSNEFEIAQYKALVASVYLETCLFYSGFYYPLYFYGQGKLMQAGEIINLIIRDESIHGVFVGRLAQELYEGFDEETQSILYEWAKNLLSEIYEVETELISEIYDPVGLTHDVKIFVRYNANKAMMNLGFDEFFEVEEVNPIVLNGLNTESKSHDFFSLKGNSYQKINTENLRDVDFDVSDVDRGLV